jgi:hypothetical protein
MLLHLTHTLALLAPLKPSITSYHHFFINYAGFQVIQLPALLELLFGGELNLNRDYTQLVWLGLAKHRVLLFPASSPKF